MNHDLLARRLRVVEACRFKPYDDKTGLPLKPGDTIQGNITIGVGRNLFAVGLRSTEPESLLKNDMDVVEVELRHNAPIWITLDDVRQRVLAEMCFHVGSAGVIWGFPKMMAAIRRRDYRTAAQEIRASDAYRSFTSRWEPLAHAMETGEDFK